MKLFLSLDQVKLVRAALRSYQGDLEKSLKEKPQSGMVLELAEGGIQELGRLIGSLDEEISRETNY